MAPASPRHPLRVPPADFTGREEELKDLCDKLGPGGAIISGFTGGMGKTALAHKLAVELVSSTPDAQIDLDLKRSTPRAVMVHVLRVFHPREKPPEDNADLAVRYRAVLRDKRVLLLLDNAHDSAQIEPLLPPPGSLAIITASRRLSLPEVYARTIDNLSPPDAVALLRRIAPRLDAATATVIAALCGYCALSLRLAASALASRASLEPGEVVERLEAAQDGLALADASLRVNVELLDPRMQLFWSSLSIFPGDFDREAAAAVGELEPAAVRKALGGLLKYGLLDYDPPSKRFRLHDLTRAYALSRLKEEDRRAAARRHSVHFARVAASANQLYRRGGAPSVEGLERFDREWANIKVGHAWASASVATDDTAAALCSAYPDAAAHCLHLRQRPKDRIRWREAALVAARRLERRDAEGVHLGNLGLSYAALGEVRRAVEIHEQQLDITRELGDRRAEIIALGDLGIACAAAGELKRAMELDEQLLVLTRELGDRRGEASALGNLALACAELGDPRRAMQLIKKQLVLTRELGDRLGEAHASWNFGRRLEGIGELEKAISFMQVCVTFEQAIGHPSAERDARYLDGLRARLAPQQST